MSSQLRKAIKEEGVIVAPGVFNPIVALLAERIGFRALYFSGGAFANSLALPDLGVTTLSEVVRAASEITSVINVPLIVDVDTGFGEALNVMRTVELMERANVAAIHIEDQVMPKKCGHLPNKEVVPTEEMVKKIIAAKQTSKSGIVVIARTDARAVEGLDSAIERAQTYVKAGADMIFPEALESEDEFKEFAKKVHAPLLANMTEFGKTPYIEVSKFEEMGYKVVIFPMTAFRVMLKAVEEALKELKQKGTQKGLLHKMLTREQIYELISYYKYEQTDRLLHEKALALLSDTH